MRKISNLDPLKPSRADYRLIRKMLDSTYGGKVVHDEDAYELIVRVFQRAGGSWERLFLGSPRHFFLLKKVLKVAYEKEYLPRTTNWR